MLGVPWQKPRDIIFLHGVYGFISTTEILPWVDACNGDPKGINGNGFKFEVISLGDVVLPNWNMIQAPCRMRMYANGVNVSASVILPPT